MLMTAPEPPTFDDHLKVWLIGDIRDKSHIKFIRRKKSSKSGKQISPCRFVRFDPMLSFYRKLLLRGRSHTWTKHFLDQFL